MPNLCSKKVYVQVFNCKTITFKKTMNMFD